MLRIAH